MSDFPSLAEIHARHAWRYAPDRVCDCGWCGTIHDPERHLRQQHAEHVTDAWRDACTITTAEQLDALPDRSIVRAGTNGHAYEKSMLFTLTGRRWMEAGNGSPERSDAIGLPALLIWHPEWTA